MKLGPLFSHARLGFAPYMALFALALPLLSGCQIGPVSLGGDAATPTAGLGVKAAGTSQPQGTTQALATVAPTVSSSRPLSGHVEDAQSGQPIVGAEISGGGVLTTTNSTGGFEFDDVPANSKLSISAPGYAGQQADTGVTNMLAVKLRPNTLSGRVTDASTGKPISGVLVKLTLAQPASTSQTATVAPAATLTTTGSLPIGKVLAAPMQAVTNTPAPPTDLTSTVAISPTNVPTATPFPRPDAPTGPDFVSVYTDDAGNYFFKDVPPGAGLTFKMPGYKLTKMPAGDSGRKDVALDVFKVNGIYITANIAASKDLYDPLVKFVLNSRINAVVLNVQDDSSNWVFDVKNPDALAAGNTDMFLKDMPSIVKDLKSKGIYTIARITTFQQKTMAEARPDWAVKSSTTGKPWKGGYAAQQRWLDASNPGAQDYIVAMTKEVLALGFDEIQYDYVRFPSDPAPSETGDMVFSTGTLTDTGKTLALQGFFKKAYNTILPSDAFMSADVFGYTLWPDQDGKPILGVIGQVPEYLMPYTDYLSPMIYPSHFSPGEQGCAKPAQCAYKLVHKSGEFAAVVFNGQRAKYRPWLEDFDWPSADYTSPGTTKVAEQIRAAQETNSWGWLMWDASNEYRPRVAFGK
ncbi:MAG: hypothetical protein M3014_09255 [Chloroflexota bacterium]|nr:hypothetical protein [Chloroflexota bacterium]